MEYKLEEHRHRFSAWAAARAAQRGYTSVDILREALEACGIREFLNAADLSAVHDLQFRQKHEEWCKSIVKFLKRKLKNKKTAHKTTYGRAAKLVAVYLKSMIVLGGQSKSSLARVMHPPIDRRLLKNIAEAKDVVFPDKKGLRKENWTELDRKHYYALVEQLRECLPDGRPFWMLEQYWP